MQHQIVYVMVWEMEYGVNYDHITSINDEDVENYYDLIVLEKRKLINAAREEKEMVRN